MIDTPERSSASMRLGFRVWSRPRELFSLAALVVDTGSAKRGTLALAASQAMDSSGMLASTMMSCALSSRADRADR